MFANLAAMFDVRLFDVKPQTFCCHDPNLTSGELVEESAGTDGGEALYEDTAVIPPASDGPLGSSEAVAAPAVMIARSPSLTRCDSKELQRWVADVKQFAVQAGSKGLPCDVVDDDGRLSAAQFRFNGDARTVEIGACRAPAALGDLLVIGGVADEPAAVPATDVGKLPGDLSQYVMLCVNSPTKSRSIVFRPSGGCGYDANAFIQCLRVLRVCMSRSPHLPRDFWEHLRSASEGERQKWLTLVVESPTLPKGAPGRKAETRKADACERNEAQSASTARSPALRSQRSQQADAVFAEYSKAGVLHLRDVQKLFGVRFGVKLSAREWQDIVRKFDQNGDGVIDREEFQALVGLVVPEKPKRAPTPKGQAQADAVFAEYSTRGVLYLRDVQKLFEVRFGVKLSAREWEEVVRKFDQNGDGVIDREEFQALVALLT